MAARVGAVFALPAVALWAWILVTDRPSNRSCRGLAASLVGLAVGAVLQAGVVLMIGLDPFHTGSNFAASLYGLSIGSRDWTDAYRDFAPVFQSGEKAAFERVYAAAFENIAARPGVFLAGLGATKIDYVRSLFRFGFFESANRVLSTAAMLGVIACIRCFGPTVARLLHRRCSAVVDCSLITHA